MDCHYKYLRQFAIMGHTYIKHFLDKEEIKVGLLNVGEEPTKGNDLAIKSYKDLEMLPYHFIGNVEPKAIVKGDADIIICDGFAGRNRCGGCLWCGLRAFAKLPGQLRYIRRGAERSVYTHPEVLRLADLRGLDGRRSAGILFQGA